MILSKQDEFSNAQAITTGAVSVNQLDLGPPAYTGSSNGSSRGGEVFVNVDTDFTAAGSATLAVAVRTSDAADMSNPTTLATSIQVPVASLKRGLSLRAAGLNVRIPENCKRYVDLFYIVGNGPFTAGTLSARASLGLPNSVGA